MPIRVPAAGLGTPPETYDRDYMLSLVRSLEMALRQAGIATDFVASSVTIVKNPQSGYALQAGALWQDGDGFIHIVRPGDVYMPSVRIRPVAGRMGAT
jgi:hypothetical protein